MNSAPDRPAGLDLAPELSLYRDRTLALLRRYERLSVEVGRLPSLVGREFFRAKVTSYRQSTFEDVVIFVHDIESAVESISPRSRLLLARIALQDYSEQEVATEARLTERRIRDLYHDALDELSRILLRRGILNAVADARAPRRYVGEGRRQQDEISLPQDDFVEEFIAGVEPLLANVNTPSTGISLQAVQT